MQEICRKGFRWSTRSSTEVFILGKKNGEFIGKLNAEERLFDKLTLLEHQRYIQQYRSKEKELYIDKYLKSFYSDNHNSSYVAPVVWIECQNEKCLKKNWLNFCSDITFLV